MNTHGIKGCVRILPWADDAAFLTQFHRFYIDGKAVNVRSCMVRKNMCVAALEGVDDLDAAIALKDKIIYIDRKDASLPAGKTFVQDVLGATVLDQNGCELGKLAEVIQTPANNVLVVKQGAKEILIPDLPEFVMAQDPDAGIIQVQVIDGML